VKFTKTAKSEVYKNLRKFLEIYKNYKTEVYKNHRKSEVYKNRIFFEIYKFTRVKFTKTTCSLPAGSRLLRASQSLLPGAPPKGDNLPILPRGGGGGTYIPQQNAYFGNRGKRVHRQCKWENRCVSVKWIDHKTQSKPATADCLVSRRARYKRVKRGK